MHRHVSKHMKRRWADAEAARLLGADTHSGVQALFGTESGRPAIHVGGRVYPVRSLGAARKICARLRLTLVEPIVARHVPRNQLPTWKLWRAAADAAWASQRVRGDSGRR